MNPTILQTIKKIYFLSSRVVPYRPRETVCPVCEFLGTVDRSSVKVLKTAPDGIRYCECLKCGSHFRAFQEPCKTKIEKVQKSCTNKGLSVKTEVKAGKKGNGDKLTGSRTRSSKRSDRSNSKRRTELSDKQSERHKSKS